MISPRISANPVTQSPPADGPAPTASLPESQPTSRRPSGASGALAHLPEKEGLSSASSGVPTVVPQGQRNFASLPDRLSSSSPLRSVAPVFVPLPGGPFFADIMTQADKANDLDTLNALVGKLPANNPSFETLYTKISEQMAAPLKAISTLPEAARTTVVLHCMASIAKMEPPGLRAVSYALTFARTAKFVQTGDHQAVFDAALEGTMQTVPEGEQGVANEQGVALRALIRVPFPEGHGKTVAESEIAAANILRVLKNMMGITGETETDIIATALTQGNTLCEPGRGEVRAAALYAWNGTVE